MTMNTLTNIHKKEGGMSLLLVLILLAAIGIVAFGASVAVYTDLQVGRNNKLAEQATFLAETGAEALWHDFRWAPDVDNDGQIDIVGGVNDLDGDGLLDYSTVFIVGTDLGSAAAPVTVLSNSSAKVVAWVEANQPGPGQAVVHSKGMTMMNGNILAKKLVDFRIDNTAGKVIQGTINNAVPCGITP